MKHRAPLAWLLSAMVVLALFAAGMGLLLQNPGSRFEYTNHRGETVMINGHGLYSFDTVSSAAQQQASDLITLVVGLPLLVVSWLLAFRGSLRARLVLAGTIGYFLYTYLSMSMLTSYNALFLVYVALFASSLYAFILCLMSFDISGLPGRFSRRLPHGWISALLFAFGGFLLVAWMGRIIGPLVRHTTPPLENATTLVIQAMDLGLIVPVAILSGVLLLKRSPWGYLLSSVVVLKGVTLGLAVSAMAVNMGRSGVPESPAVMVPFLFLTAASIVVAVMLLRYVEPRQETTER